MYKTDDFFAPAERIINPLEPIWKEGLYDNNGKWQEGNVDVADVTELLATCPCLEDLPRLELREIVQMLGETTWGKTDSQLRKINDKQAALGVTTGQTADQIKDSIVYQTKHPREQSYTKYCVIMSAYFMDW